MAIILLRRLWTCTVCEKTFPTKEAVEGHIVNQHQSEVYEDQDTEDSDDGMESDAEDSDYKDEESDDSVARYLKLFYLFVMLPFPHSRPRSRTAKRRRRSAERPGAALRRPLLDPCPEVVRQEAELRARAYREACLPELAFPPSPWQLEDRDTAFLPSETVSVKFTVSQRKGSECGEPQVLERFGGAVGCGSRSLYCGGPVWGLAWCPGPQGHDQLLAVATGLDHSRSPLSGARESRGLIQFWRCGGKEEAPVFQLGLGHSYGRVWGLAWCPSGGQKEDREGLLAAACSDGSVRIWAVPRPGKLLPGRVYSGAADRSLLPGAEEDRFAGQCLALSWHRGLGHRHLAASFSSGLVCVWDLASQSRLLRLSPTALLPHTSWTAHSGSVTGVSLCHETQELARHLVTGGTDRCYRFWDLRDTSVPLQEVKRGLVSGVSWLPGWAAAAVSYDDVYLQSHTQTLVAETGFYSNRSQPIIAQNSGVWAVDTSPWAGAVAVGTAAGELIVFVLPPSDRSMEHDKNVCQRRSYVYRTELEVEDKGEDSREYGAVRESATLRFLDLPRDCPVEETRRVRCAERMDQEDLSCYPLAGVTRVAWNPNLGSHLELASGGQAGLVRLHSLDIDTQELGMAVREAEA